MLLLITIHFDEILQYTYIHVHVDVNVWVYEDCTLFSLFVIPPQVINYQCFGVVVVM